MQDIAKTADLNAKYDVILFPPSGGNGQGIVDGLPKWRNPMPWKNTPETPNIGTWAQTDDMRQGHGVVFANNPVWRGETLGSYFLVFNTILNWDNLNAGRTLDPR